MIVLASLFALFLFAGGLGLHLAFRRFKGESLESRFLLGAMPLLLFLVLALLVRTVALMPGRDWNACRVAPSVALAYGYTLYYGPDEGPILNTLYAPVTAVAFLPAALGKDPTTAILIAGTINVAFMALPLFLLLWKARAPDEAGPVAAALRLSAFIFALGCVYQFVGTEYAINSIHADSPAMGLMLSACTVLILAPGTPGNGRLFAAAGLAALACYTKQIEVFALPGLFFYLGLAFSWRVAFIFTAFVIAWAAVLAGVFAVAFDFKQMLFNIVELPKLHPWKGPRVPILFKSLLKLTTGAGFMLLLVLPFLVNFAAGWKTQSLRAALAANRWVLLLLVSVTMLPGSLMGEVKVGGMENSLHSAFYLMAGGALALSRWACGVRGTEQRVAVAACFALAALLLGLRLPAIAQLAGVGRTYDNPQQAAFEFAKKHPGEALFPWNTLSTLLADGKLYHFEYGLYDRVLAGYRPTDEHFRQHLPANLKYLIFRQDRECFQMRQFLPEFSRVTTVERLDQPFDQPPPAKTVDPMKPPEENLSAGAGWFVYQRGNK